MKILRDFSLHQKRHSRFQHYAETGVSPIRKGGFDGDFHEPGRTAHGDGQTVPDQERGSQDSGENITGTGIGAVSYTHLDGYKRQAAYCPGNRSDQRSPELVEYGGSWKDEPRQFLALPECLSLIHI